MNQFLGKYRCLLFCTSDPSPFVQQNVGQMNQEVFSALTRSKRRNKGLRMTLQDKTGEIAALRLALEEKTAELEEVKNKAGDPEEARRLRDENRDLFKNFEKQEQEMKTVKDAIVAMAKEHKKEKAEDEQKIKDLQLQLSSRLNELNAFDENLMIPADIELTTEERIARCNQLGDLVANLGTSGKKFVKKFFPTKSKEIADIEAIPSLLEEAAGEYDERLRSAARGGAVAALGLTKIHYDGAEINLIASGVPQDVTAEEADEAFAAVAGYATKVAQIVNIKIHHPAVECPESPKDTAPATSPPQED